MNSDIGDSQQCEIGNKSSMGLLLAAAVAIVGIAVRRTAQRFQQRLSSENHN